MLPLSEPRCSGCTTVRQKPLPCCIQCERRIYPPGSEKALVWHEWVPDLVNRQWVCSGQIPYGSSGVALAAFQPAGASNGPAGFL